MLRREPLFSSSCNGVRPEGFGSLDGSPLAKADPSQHTVCRHCRNLLLAPGASKLQHHMAQGGQLLDSGVQEAGLRWMGYSKGWHL